jgi:hypothetical protein
MSRAVYAFGRDHGTVHVILDDIIYIPYPPGPKGLPDGGYYFGKISDTLCALGRVIFAGQLTS